MPHQPGSLSKTAIAQALGKEKSDLFGSCTAFKALRKLLVERCDLKAVIGHAEQFFQALCRRIKLHSAFYQSMGPARQGHQTSDRAGLVLQRVAGRLHARRQAQQAGWFWRSA